MKRTCPGCGNVVKFEQVDAEKQNDLLGRTQYQCSHCGEVCVEICDEMMCMQGDNPAWENNLLQFARILAELRAIGLGEGIWDNLAQETGLTSDQLSDVFQRAQMVWEQSKELEFKPNKAAWQISCRGTKVLTWRVLRRNDKDPLGVDAIDLPVLPYNIGPRIARTLALALNTDPRTMGVEPVLSTDDPPKKK